MPIGIGMAVAGVANLAGSFISGNAAQSAAKQQSEAALKAAEAQRIMAEKNATNLQDVANKQMTNLSGIYNTNVGSVQPFVNTGTTAANSLNDLVKSGYFSKQFTAEDLKANLAPNYEFMLNQGLGAAKQTLNVGGGGSNIARGATKFAEDYASNAYQQAFNNWQSQRQGIYSTLSGIANIGTTGTGQGIGAGNVYGYNTTGLTTGTGMNIANLLTGGANATAAGITGAGQAGAAGTVGAANALSGGIVNSGNLYALNELLKAKSDNPLAGDIQELLKQA